jgi:hypothetical protein
VTRLAAVDAQNFWMSAKIPNDQFLLYGFSGVPGDVRDALSAVRQRALDCPELSVRIDESDALRYPAWAHCSPADEAFVVHQAEAWAECLALVQALSDRQLDPRERPWRVHVFAGVSGIPGANRPGTVVMVQISHALGDGIRSSALAARLLGRDVAVPAVVPRRLGGWALPYLALRASRAHRQLVRDTESGVVAAPGDSFPLQPTNARPDAPHRLRTIVRRRSQLPGPSVTVGVLAAVSGALAVELDGPTVLGAEVPMAKTGVRHANNHFGNVSVGLHPNVPFVERAGRIAAELAARRQRFEHPATAASDAAFAATPAPLLRWGTAQFDPSVRSTTVGGNTVVSSVNRGPADLRFGDCAVVVTSGFPALSPMMGLTHGVHGIGDTVTISVHAAASAVPDLDRYVARLTAELDNPH